MRVVALLLLALTLAGCAYREQPIYNPENSIPLPAQALPLERIEALIIEGGGAHGWTFRRIEPGHLEATHKQEKYGAVVDVRFDTRMWRIVHQSSIGLREKNGRIHSHYNLWVRNLEHDITARLSSASR